MHKACLILAALAAAGACQAAPVTILTNLPGTGTYNGSSVFLSLSSWGVAGLTMGASDMIFSSLQVYLSSGAPTATVSGGIYTDSSGHPGSIYAAFISHTFGPIAPTLETFVTSSPVMLFSGISYWFLLDDAGGVIWLSDSSNGSQGSDPVPCSGCAFLGYETTVNSGGAWTPASGIHPTIEVDAFAAPEPGTLLLLSAGAAVLFLRRKRAAGTSRPPECAARKKS